MKETGGSEIRVDKNSFSIEVYFHKLIIKLCYQEKLSAHS